LYGLHYYNAEQEQEAKFLGACLQISRPGLQWAVKEGLTNEEMSNHFNASLEMVRFRLNTSGVLKQHAAYKMRG
jgi:Zn-dependent peptidase ImmA (M78 family)